MGDALNAPTHVESVHLSVREVLKPLEGMPPTPVRSD